MDSLDVTLSIVNFNGKALLGPLLNSILTSPPRCRYEIRVWDNASSDGSVAYLQQSYPSVHVQANPENVYYAQGNNRNLKNTSSRYVLILNTDLEFAPGAIDRLLEVLDHNPTVGIVGPQIRSMAGGIEESGCRFHSFRYGLYEYLFINTLWPNNAEVRHYRYEVWDRTQEKSVDFISGACMMVRRDLFDRLQGFDDQHFVFYGEETDLCWRARQAGWDVRYDPVAQVRHHRAATTRHQDPWEIFRLRHRSLLNYYLKYHGVWAYTVLWPLYWIHYGVLRLYKAIKR